MLGELVHPRAGRKVQSVLLAAVEHDHEWDGFTGVARRDVEAVAAVPALSVWVEVADLTTRRGSAAQLRQRRSRASGPRGPLLRVQTGIKGSVV